MITFCHVAAYYIAALPSQVSMGSLKELHQTKNEMRRAAGLPEWPEDNVEVCRNIRASTPPAAGMEFMDGRRSRQARQVCPAVY